MRPKVKVDDIKDIKTLSKFLDSSIHVGGMELGWDGLIGLIPGIGDLITGALSCYVLVRAALLNAPKPILIKMGTNIAIDQLIGMIPIIGDGADFFWRANKKNYELLEAFVMVPNSAVQRSTLSLVLIGLACFAVLVVPFIFLFYIITLI